MLCVNPYSCLNYYSWWGCAYSGFYYGCFYFSFCRSWRSCFLKEISSLRVATYPWRSLLVFSNCLIWSWRALRSSSRAKMVLSLSTSWCSCEFFSYLLWAYYNFLSFCNCESCSLRAAISFSFCPMSAVNSLIFPSATLNCYLVYSDGWMCLGMLSRMLNVSWRVLLKSSNLLALSSASYFLAVVSCRFYLVSLSFLSALSSKDLSSLILSLL